MKSLFYSLTLLFTIFIVKPESAAQNATEGATQKAPVATPQIGAGIDLVYAFGNKDFATRAHAQYSISDLFAARVDVTYLFNGIEDLSEIHFKIGPRANYHFNNFFSIHAEVGFVFALVNASPEAAFISGNASGVSVGAGAHYSISKNVDIDVEGMRVIGGPDQLFGAAGFTVWFN